MTKDRERIDLEAIDGRYRRVVGFKVKRALGAGNPDWEDVTSEILVQAIDKVRSGEFRGESSVGTFIYTIAVRRIADYIRQKGKLLKEAPEPAPLPDPHKEAERNQRRERLAAAVRELAPKYREVLDLYYFQELTREETASRLGITPAKVSERVNYAQKILKRMLEP